MSGSLKIDPKDIHAVANQLLFEVNLTAGQLLILHHKLIHVLRVVPRFVSEYLQVEYESKSRETWSECIFRQVIPTANFALLPKDEDQDIGEAHTRFALRKREQESED